MFWTVLAPSPKKVEIITILPSTASLYLEMTVFFVPLIHVGHDSTLPLGLPACYYEQWSAV